ncbi:hypothetical protein B0H63DRAFT_562917 [Podospora didyma]|uniref:Uncharacterized protein n=1 Tax=Podospora didyma TaxID=330526 RepID=A0AAE0KEA0_9PEZI|nr:hypothetical protein B0H63DRAFT_562917 [Podospora didyma]
MAPMMLSRPMTQPQVQREERLVGNEPEPRKSDDSQRSTASIFRSKNLRLFKKTNGKDVKSNLTENTKRCWICFASNRRGPCNPLSRSHHFPWHDSGNTHSAASNQSAASTEPDPPAGDTTALPRFHNGQRVFGTMNIIPSVRGRLNLRGGSLRRVEVSEEDREVFNMVSSDETEEAVPVLAMPSAFASEEERRSPFQGFQDLFKGDLSLSQVCHTTGDVLGTLSADPVIHVTPVSQPPAITSTACKMIFHTTRRLSIKSSSKAQGQAIFISGDGTYKQILTSPTLSNPSGLVESLTDASSLDKAKGSEACKKPKTHGGETDNRFNTLPVRGKVSKWHRRSPNCFSRVVMTTLKHLELELKMQRIMTEIAEYKLEMRGEQLKEAALGFRALQETHGTTFATPSSNEKTPSPDVAYASPTVEDDSSSSSGSVKENYEESTTSLVDSNQRSLRDELLDMDETFDSSILSLGTEEILGSIMRAFDF